MKDRKILIIGGCGFIGSALVEKYYKDNKIVVVDYCSLKNTSLDLRKIPDENITFIQQDATDLNKMLELGEDFDYIIHASAILGIKKVVIESINTITTNIKSCYNALELSTRQKHLKKFLTFSTSEVYGIKAEKPSEEEPSVIQPATEARWNYSASKTLSEHLTFAYHREKDIPITIIRPFNVFGEFRKGSNAMTSFLERAMKNENLIIDGDGQQVRSWCHIDDFINGLSEALESDYDNEIFNIGNPNNEITIENLAKKIINITKSKSEIIITNSSEPDVKYRSVCIDKAKKMLNYTPKVSIEDGIKKVYEWMRESK